MRFDGAAPPILRIAKLMHAAYGVRAADQALMRSLEHADRSEPMAADLWASIAVAIRCHSLGAAWDEH